MAQIPQKPTMTRSHFARISNVVGILAEAIEIQELLVQTHFS